MHPSLHAQRTPDKPALILAGGGTTVSYRELDRRSNQIAHFLRSRGIEVGDVIALCMENNARYLEIAWATQRSGIYLACISTKLTAGEVEYIVRDCGAKLFIGSGAMESLLKELKPLLEEMPRYIVGKECEGYLSLDAAVATMPDGPIPDQATGGDMLYSSGTTGRPKGIKQNLTGDAFDAPNTLTQLAIAFYRVGPETVYLSPAPLYHAAPLRWCMTIQRLGGTVIVMEHFDAERALALIEKYRVTASQWVPTHFVRMLRLPASTRAKYDLSSLRVAIHAAAPCAIPVKEQMMEWWGSVLYEYYAGTEGNGMTFITPEEWLRKKGSVGKPIYGKLHICDAAGHELPPNTEGVVYFSDTREFSYHNAPDKTLESRNAVGWSTLGDIGYLDDDGYLFLTDRKAFMIISGGVNIYPQEIENVLVTHPKVMDVAVIGAPDEEMGEKVVAIVQPVDWSDAGAPLATELDRYARARLSHVKTPRKIDFLPELPRHPNGKLYKRLLRDAYWGQRGSRIV